MFNLVSNLGAKRDDYGVSDLLAEVSKRSASISPEDREEISAMSQRLRQHRSNEHTPRQTPDNSAHGVKRKDVLKKDDLLRGFASFLHSPVKRTQEQTPASPPSTPSRPDHGDPNLLRDFNSPSKKSDTPDEAASSSLEAAQQKL